MRLVYALFLLLLSLAWSFLAHGQQPAANGSPSPSCVLLGYEIARQDAAALLVNAPAKIDAQPLLLQIAGLASRGKGRVLKMPVATGGPRRFLGVDGDFKWEFEMQVGPGGDAASFNGFMNRGALSMSSSTPCKIPGVFLFGSFEEPGRDTVTMIFVKVGTP